jgi:hypothetical protein
MCNAHLAVRIQFVKSRYLICLKLLLVPTSTPAQTGPEAHQVSYTMGTGLFHAVKRAGRGVDHPPTSSAEVNERVELHPTPLWAFVACSRVKFSF